MQVMAAYATANAPHLNAEPQPQPRLPTLSTTSTATHPSSQANVHSTPTDPGHSLHLPTASGVETGCTNRQHVAQELAQSRKAAAATPSTTATAAMTNTSATAAATYATARAAATSNTTTAVALCATSTAEANSPSATAPGSKQHAAQQMAGPEQNAAQQQGCVDEADEAERHKAGLCPVGISTYTEVSHC